jgi:uncharacterized protein YoxC
MSTSLSDAIIDRLLADHPNGAVIKAIQQLEHRLLETENKLLAVELARTSVNHDAFEDVDDLVADLLDQINHSKERLDTLAQAVGDLKDEAAAINRRLEEHLELSKPTTERVQSILKLPSVSGARCRNCGVAVKKGRTFCSRKCANRYHAAEVRSRKGIETAYGSFNTTVVAGEGVRD